VGPAEKQKLLATTDALLFPSIWSENAPVVLCEAFMQGVPVLASDLGAIPEFVNDGVNGILCEAGNPASFAVAAQRLRSDIEFYAELSSGATKSAAKYAVTTMGNNYLSVYYELLGRAA
jgi:glycosyltransferase involved in cell wall biosynthesis